MDSLGLGSGGANLDALSATTDGVFADDYWGTLNARRAALRRGKYALAAMDEFYQRAYTMISSPEAREAFELRKEKPETIKKYGATQPGLRFLLARRLVESGVRRRVLTVAFEKQSEGDTTWGLSGGRSGGAENNGDPSTRWEL